MSAKRKHRTTNEYLKYLKGELSREERHSFERDLQANPFDTEAMEGMEQSNVDELEEDLLSIHATLHKRIKRRRRRSLYYVAATVASLLLVGTVFLNIYDMNPKSASESIPREEAIPAPAEATVQEKEPEPDKAITLEEDLVQGEDLAKEKARGLEETPGPEREEAPVQEEIIVHEEMAMHADEVMDDEEVGGVAQVQVQEVSAPVQEVSAPVQEADELVVMEAQAKRSRKKGMTREEPAPAKASTSRVSGIVVSSEDMEPLPGASIMVKGSDSGQVADMEGRFSLVTDQQPQTTVIASYVGMETEEYQLSGSIENQVVMQPDMATLDEVVVIGYEVDKSLYATGAVQTINLDKEDIKYNGAEPEGGLASFKMYIEEHIRFPDGENAEKREVVVLKFNVEADGSISHIITLRSPGDSFTEEAISLLNEGPSWIPARNESGPVKDVVRMRIVFKR